MCVLVYSILSLISLLTSYLHLLTQSFQARSSVTGAHIISTMKPQVLLLQQGPEYQREIFDDLYKGLCSQIEEHYTVIKANSLTIGHLAHSKAIIVTDGGLSKKKNKNFHVRLSEYAKTGGTVILACLFSSFTCGPDFDSMSQTMNLAWSWGDYHVCISYSQSFLPRNASFASTRCMETSY